MMRTVSNIMLGALLLVAAKKALAEPLGAQPYVRIAELGIDPGYLAEYKAILAKEQEASVRDEPGVVMLHSVALKDQPNQIRLLEVYASRDAYEAHIKSPHFLRYKESTAKMVISLKLVDTDPIRLCAKIPAGAGSSSTCK